MEFSRQEYWRGFPFSSPGDLPHPGIRPLAILWKSAFKWANLSFSPLPLASLLFSAVLLSAFLSFSQGFCASLIRDGSGNPFQYSCLENPRDGGAWWAAIYGVAQSQTRLKRLSSSSSSCNEHGGTRISFNPGFLSVYAQQWIAGSYAKASSNRSILQFL